MKSLTKRFLEKVRKPTALTALSNKLERDEQMRKRLESLYGGLSGSGKITVIDKPIEFNGSFIVDTEEASLSSYTTFASSLWMGAKSTIMPYSSESASGMFFRSFPDQRMPVLQPSKPKVVKKIRPIELQTKRKFSFDE